MLCVDMDMKNNKLYWDKEKKPTNLQKVHNIPFSRDFLKCS